MEQSLDINYPHPPNMIELSPERIAFLSERGLLGDGIMPNQEAIKGYEEYQAWRLANPEDAAKFGPVRTWLHKDSPLLTIPLTI